MHAVRRPPVARYLPALLLLPATLACGCETLSTTDRGVIGGGLLGAGTGAMVGHATGDTAAGALVGGAVGAVGGGLVGNAIENSERRQDAKLAAAAAQAGPCNGPLDINGVVMLAQQGVSDDVIINQIQTTGSVFRLNPNDLVYLQQCRVSDKVIQAMQRTAAYGPPGPRVMHAPHPVHIYHPAPVYVVEPPPPPPRIGFGFGFSSCGRCR